MATFHQITAVGYAGGNAELRYTGEGDPVAGFSLGVTDRNKAGDEHTEWYRCSVWGKSADVAAEYIKKGEQVMVQGRPRVETFKRRDGTIGAMTKISVERFILLGKGRDSDAESVSHAGPPTEQSNADSQFGNDDLPM